MPKPTPSKTRIKNGEVRTQKDESLIDRLIEEKLLAQMEILSRSELRGEEYDYKSPYYGASFKKSFSSEADFFAYVEWKESERGWNKHGDPTGNIHRVLKP